MTKEIKLGVLFVALTALAYVVIFSVISFGRAYEIKTYPRYLVPIAAIFPLFFGSFFATRMIRENPVALNRREIITFGLIATIGVGIIGFLAEAYYLYRSLATVQEITFSEVLFAPLNARYNMPVLFGASFALSATIVSAYVSFLRIPGTIHVRLRKSKPTTPAL